MELLEVERVLGEPSMLVVTESGEVKCIAHQIDYCGIALYIVNIQDKEYKSLKFLTKKQALSWLQSEYSI